MECEYCYKPLESRSRWLSSSIVAAILLWAGALFADLHKLHVLNNIKNLEYTTEESLEMAVGLSLHK